MGIIKTVVTIYLSATVDTIAHTGNYKKKLMVISYFQCVAVLKNKAGTKKGKKTNV